MDQDTYVSHKIKSKHQGQNLDSGANIFKMTVLKKIEILKNVKMKAINRNRYNQVQHLTQETIWVSVKKTQESTTHKRAKRSVPSQQMTTRLKREDKRE